MTNRPYGKAVYATHAASGVRIGAQVCGTAGQWRDAGSAVPSDVGDDELLVSVWRVHGSPVGIFPLSKFSGRLTARTLTELS